MTQIPDYGNLKMNMEGFTRFLKDSGVELNATQRENINSIFKECDTENAKGEKRADGELTGKERMTFLDKVKAQCAELYQQATDFFTVVDVVEGLKGKENKQGVGTIGKGESDKNGIKAHSALNMNATVITPEAAAAIVSSAQSMEKPITDAAMKALNTIPSENPKSVIEEGDKE